MGHWAQRTVSWRRLYHGPMGRRLRHASSVDRGRNESLSAELTIQLRGSEPDTVRAAVARTRYASEGERPVSVVVPTVGRWASLKQCIASILPQLRAPDELLVVLNGPDQHPPGLLPTGTVLIRERRPGASWARNAGWHSARHADVVFVDDDTVPDDVWLEALRGRITDFDIVTGSVIAANPLLPTPRLFDREYPLHRGWVPRRYGCGWSPPITFHDTWRVGVGASMAWRRTMLERIGGFDAALGNGRPGGGAEDLDAFHRATSAGGTIAYEPRAMVRHWHPETPEALRDTIRSYQRAVGAWSAKRVMEQVGWRGAVELAGPLVDSYRSAVRSIVGGSPLPALAQLGAGLDAARGAAAFAAGRGPARRGETMSKTQARPDQSRVLDECDLEVDVTAEDVTTTAHRSSRTERILLRNARHPVALVQMPPTATVADAIGTWSRWVLACPEGTW